MVDALRFELGKVETASIRERIVGLLSKVDTSLAKRVAEGLGIEVLVPKEPLNHNFGADARPSDYQDHPAKQAIDKSSALSMAGTIKNTIKTRQIAVLAADGVDGGSIKTMVTALLAGGAIAKIIAPKGGFIKDAQGGQVKVDMSFLTAASVLFDAVFIPGGEKSIAALKNEPEAIHFINESYKHCKAIAAEGSGNDLLNETYVGAKLKQGKSDASEGIITSQTSKPESFVKDFIYAISQHRFWAREKADKVPA